MFLSDDPTPLCNDPETTPADKPLNPRQEAFCQVYVQAHNAAQAARLAGYGEVHAKQQGHRLLKDPRVRRRLRRLRDALLDEAAARERDWMDKLETVYRQAMAEGALHPAVRAVEAQARIVKLGIAARRLEPGSEEGRAAEAADFEDWIRLGEAEIAESRGETAAESDGGDISGGEEAF